MTLTLVSTSRSFGGEQRVYRHASTATGTDMEFAAYLPREALRGEACPTLFYLSGLTCTWQNATDKAGYQRLASMYELIVIAPDTSPRGDDVANDEAYDLGQGAGFYVDATEAKWKEHYQMYSYVTTELPEVLAATFPGKFSGKASITGHSMGCAATPAPAHPLSAAEPLCHPVPADAPRRSFPTGPRVAAVGTAR